MSYYEPNIEDEDRTGSYPFADPGASGGSDSRLETHEFELWVAAGIADLEELLATHAAFDDWRDTMRRRYGSPDGNEPA